MYNFAGALDNVKKAGEQANEDGLYRKIQLNVKGSAIGLAAGVMFGYAFKKNLWVMGAIGAVAGGLIAKSLTSKENES